MADYSKRAFPLHKSDTACNEGMTLREHMVTQCIARMAGAARYEALNPELIASTAVAIVDAALREMRS